MHVDDYHCHQKEEGSSSSFHENLQSVGTEVTYQYNYGLVGNAALSGSIRIDLETDEYVIEGGEDKRLQLG